MLYKDLEAECERAKIALQKSTEVTISQQSFYDGKDLSVKITRDKLQAGSEKLMTELNKVTDEALNDASFEI